MSIEGGHPFKPLSWVTGKCACVQEDSCADGAQVHGRDHVGNNPFQPWDLVDAGNGRYEIRNVGSGKLRDVAYSSTADNAPRQQYPDNGNVQQQGNSGRVP